MFCPYCSEKIPDGSNICPVCCKSLPGVKAQTTASGRDDGHSAAKSKKKSKAYTKGSRGGKKNADRAPMIIAFGLIVILLVIIVLIARSMFSVGNDNVRATPVPAQVQNTPEGGFTVFGQSTPLPTTQIVTPTPKIEITPTPAPTSEPEYHTLRKGDQGPAVVTLQQALTELGYLKGAADGNFGTGTMTAVREFQAAEGLDADGIAGKLTQAALFAKSSVTPIPETTVGPDDIMNLPG
ncbi:MAG: peptidoglycan-binding protein [Clostridia bacterium]|nr:peptidoglycan-binding protein [Clostridia bacterium]